MWTVLMWIVLIDTILLIVDVTDKLNIVDRQDSAAVCLARKGERWRAG